MSSFLDEVSGAGEAAQEFLELFCALTEEEKGKWKLYLAQKSVLLKIGNLIGKVGRCGHVSNARGVGTCHVIVMLLVVRCT